MAIKVDNDFDKITSSTGITQFLRSEGNKFERGFKSWKLETMFKSHLRLIKITLFTVMTEAANFFEKLVRVYQSTWRHVPEDHKSGCPATSHRNEYQ
jgi:hypothetical protein